MNIDGSILKAWRVVSQRLGSQQLDQPGQVVEWLGGVQAQDYRWAKWSIGLRTDGRTDVEVEKAIEDHQIMRTWMFRGTLHFIAASDLVWLTALLAPGILRGNARRYRELELSQDDFVRSQKALQHAIELSGPLTRPEIKMLFKDEGIPAEGQQLPYLLQRAALDGLIFQGSLSGSDPTYHLTSGWIVAPKALNRVEALGLLAVRYFASHGPATLKDFAWWSGLAASEARLAVEAAPDLASIEVDGVKYWATGDPPSSELTTCGCVLPPFDEYLLGYVERSLILDPAFARRVNFGGGGILKPTVMVNGDILGVLSYKRKKGDMVVSIEPFRSLGSHEQDLVDRAASQLSGYMSAQVVTSIVSK